MDLATVMSIVQTVLTALQCSHQLLKDLSFPGYKSEIKSLQSTLNTVSAVLQDAEARQDALSEQQKQYVEELKDAVYDVDDVLDEFTTLVQRKKLILDGPKVSDKIAKITEDGAAVSPPYSLKTFWDFAAFKNPTAAAEGSW